MIGKIYQKRLVFGNKPEDIEGYDDAIDSDELYVCHHVLEYKYTSEELRAMNRYKKVKADELIWIPKSVHQGNKYLHKSSIIGQTGDKNPFFGKHHTDEHKQRMKELNTGEGNPNFGKHWITDELGERHLE